MAKLRFQRHILKWGNGYGIRLTKDDMEKLHAAPKTLVDVEVRTESTRINPLRLRMLKLGRDASRRHTELAQEAADADL